MMLLKWSSSEWNAIEVKKGYYKSVSWVLLIFKLLERPYSTDCKNYSTSSVIYPSRRDCIRNCKLMTSLDIHFFWERLEIINQRCDHVNFEIFWWDFLAGMEFDIWTIIKFIFDLNFICHLSMIISIIIHNWKTACNKIHILLNFTSTIQNEKSKLRILN